METMLTMSIRYPVRTPSRQQIRSNSQHNRRQRWAGPYRERRRHRAMVSTQRRRTRTDSCIRICCRTETWRTESGSPMPSIIRLPLGHNLMALRQLRRITSGILVIRSWLVPQPQRPNRTIPSYECTRRRTSDDRPKMPAVATTCRSQNPKHMTYPYRTPDDIGVNGGRWLCINTYDTISRGEILTTIRKGEYACEAGEDMISSEQQITKEWYRFMFFRLVFFLLGGMGLAPGCGGNIELAVRKFEGL